MNHARFLPAESAERTVRLSGIGAVQNRMHWFRMAAVSALFVALSCGTILTKRPWIDEAWFASPGLDLVEHGRMGTHVLEPTGSHLSIMKPGVRLDGIDRHTYWVMPLHFLVLALAFKLFGFSLAVLRLPALLWGLGALAAWYVIVRSLGGSKELATLTLFLISVDYAFINSASDGRMDMMCAALGFISLALYLAWRESRFLWAVLLTHALAALSLFTHPNGLLGVAAVVFVFLYLDCRRLSWAVVALTAAPYVAATLGWIAYVLADRAAFVAQFGANASIRTVGLSAPFEAIRLEIAERYLKGHFFPDEAGLGAKLKVLILVAYIALVVVILAPRLRRNRGYCLLLYLLGIRFLMMAWGTVKTEYYLVDVIPFYAFFLACAACWARQCRRFRWVTASVLCLVVGLQLGWSLQRILWLRPYQKIHPARPRYGLHQAAVVRRGWFTSPALDSVESGRMGTHILEPSGSHLSVLNLGARLDGIDQHTYWVMPLYLLVLAMLLKVFGLSLTVVRLPSLVCGLGTLAAWYLIGRGIGGSKTLAALTVFFIGIDCAFVDSASDGRMDMICAALGFLALAVYLVLRETRFLWAVFLSHTAAALSLFTHPNGALASAALVFLLVYLDRQRLQWAVVPLMGTPYVLLGLGWLAYVMKAPAAFLAQFGANASNRMAGLSAPLEAIRLEITTRYLQYHFLPGDGGFSQLKILILVAYVAAVVFVVGVGTAA